MLDVEHKSQTPNQTYFLEGKNFLDKKIKPIIEPLVESLLKDKPEEPVIIILNI